MTVRRVAVVILRSVTGVGCLVLSAYGAYLYVASGLQHDSPIVTLFCLFPMLSFPAFLLSFWRIRVAAAMQCALAAGYLTFHSMLDWRTCAELGYCGSVSSTVAGALKARSVEAAFAVAILHVAAWWLTRSGPRAIKQ
jgi:hypothetical protein